MGKNGLRFIENKVLIEVANEEENYLLIHTLLGRIDVLSRTEAEYVKHWQDKSAIYPQNKNEQAFLNELYENKYLVENTAEEEKLAGEIMCLCREQHKRRQEEKNRVVLVLTYMCNFACPYCYEKAADYKDRKVLTREMADKVYDIHGNNMEQITFYGGEPFLPETRTIIEYIISRSPNALYSAITNGYYVDQFMDILKNLQIDYLMITLDGPRNLHNKTRVLKNGEGTYTKIIKNIELCLKNEIRLKIRMNISNSNVKACLDLRETFIQKYEEHYKKGMLSFELQPIFQTASETKADLNERLLFEKSTSSGNSYNYNVTALTVSPILQEFVNSTKKNIQTEIL